MDSFRTLVARGDSSDSSSSSNFMAPSMVDLVIALLALVCFGLCLVGLLFIIRRRRQAKKEAESTILPSYHSRSSNHRRLTITATPYGGARAESIYVCNEKRDLLENSSSPPQSPVPEIRITFPDEEDHQGKRMSGKVVVLRISETGSVGMEPVSEENLPPYQSSDAERFQSLDLDRMGGLKEKDSRQWS